MSSALVMALMTICAGAGVLLVPVYLLFTQAGRITTHTTAWLLCASATVAGCIVHDDYGSASCFFVAGFIAFTMVGVSLSVQPHKLWLLWFNVAVQLTTQFLMVAAAGRDNSPWLLPAELTSVMLLIISSVWVFSDFEVAAGMTEFNAQLHRKLTRAHRPMHITHE